MKHLSITAAGLCAALLASTSAVAQQQGITDTEILIGDILPVSGPPALLGIAHTLGVKAAIAETNAAGGINGRQIRHIIEDDGYVNSRTVEGVRKLLTSHRVFALTSMSGGAQGLTILPIVAQAGIPAISSIGFADELYDPITKNVFTIGATYEEAARVVTEGLAGLNPDKSWGVLVQDDEYGTQMKRGFDTAREALGLNVVYEDIYKRGQRDFSSEMLRLHSAGAEVFLMGGIIGENVAMAKELERLGSTIPSGISFVGRVPALLNLMGPAGENIYAVDYVVPEYSDEGRAFLERLQGLLSEDEMRQVNRYTFTGYIGARAMFEAIDRCGEQPTWECTVEQLEGLTDFETGIASPISFSPESHFANLELQVMKADVENMVFVPVE